MVHFLVFFGLISIARPSAKTFIRSFHSLANKTHFDIKGFELDLAFEREAIENWEMAYCL